MTQRVVRLVTGALGLLYLVAVATVNFGADGTS
jgi:hypothetical protein